MKTKSSEQAEPFDLHISLASVTIAVSIVMAVAGLAWVLR
jgi:hypothetical protein